VNIAMLLLFFLERKRCVKNSKSATKKRLSVNFLGEMHGPTDDTCS
jgi:hypothetical protein